MSALHLITLFTLAVAHPLYEVLGQEDHLPFFTAHQSGAADIFALVLFFSVLLPAALCATLWLVNFLSRRLASALYVVLLFSLLLAAALPISARLLDSAGNLAIALSLVAAAGATLLYVFAAWARTSVTYLSIVVVLSPFLFLRSPAIQSVLSEPNAMDFALSPSPGNTPNIVLIIFDELPLISLLDENRNIDSGRYPNFHRLAKTSTWYQNTTTIDYSTGAAVTGLLIGGRRESYLQRVHGDSPLRSSGPLDRARFPHNLFSLLEEDYLVFASELVPKFAINTTQASEYVPGFRERIIGLTIDSSVLYGHVAAPERFRKLLPDMEGQWAGFLSVDDEPPSNSTWPFVDSNGRLEGIRRFIDSLQKRNSPSFYYLHTLLPHFPFVYNEKGQLHFPIFRFMQMAFRKATGTNDWPDEVTANLTYQAHLLQLGFTDLLLGRILDRLVEQGLFEDSIIVVTSDHGTNFFWDRAGLPSETLAQIQASGSMFVPLFIKLPGQTRADISQRAVQTIDLVPTIADILQRKVPWPVEGLSAIDDTSRRPERSARLGQVMTSASTAMIDAALERKLELFGSHSYDELYRSGPHKSLVGEAVASFPSNTSTAKVKLQRPSAYGSVDLEAARLPAYVEGEIHDLPRSIDASELILAVAVNGVIQQTTKTTSISITALLPNNPRAAKPSGTTQAPEGSDASDRHTRFLVRLPPESFSQGANTVTVLAVVEDESGTPVALIHFAQE
jgi:hypothetical protein